MKADPAVDSVVGFTGGGSQGADRPTAASCFISLKPKAERQLSLGPGHRPAAAQAEPGRRRAPASCRRCRTSAPAAAQSNAQYQYTLQADNVADIYEWAPKVAEALQRMPAA